MSRIRSKKLYRYLKENGGFNNPRELKRLKREYRKQYQNQWARQQRKKQCEIRFTLRKDEYQEVKKHTQNPSITPTELAKELLLSQSKETGFIPHKEELQQVAKHLGLAINQLSKMDNVDPVCTKLLHAEAQLLNYLKS